jgi:TolA-binding protein
MFQKGVVLSINNRNEQAKQALQELIEKYPKSRYQDDAHYQRALIDYESGKYEAAVAGFSALIDRFPESKLVPNALQRRGTAYANLRQNEKAIADQKRVLEEYPSANVASGALYSLQEVLGTENRSSEFDVYLDKFKAANPESNALESVEFEAAKTMYFNQKYDQAVAKFESYLNTYPKSPFAVEARYFLADSYLRQNNMQVGLQRMKAVIDENKSEYVNRAIQRVADLEFEAKRYSEAIKYYSRLRDLATNRKEQQTALSGMMLSYYQSNDYTSTKRAANELISQGNASLNAYNSALLYRAKASYAQGNLNQTLTELRETVASATDIHGAEAQYLIAEVLHKQKKYQESIDVAFDFNTKYSNYDYWLGKTFLIIADNYTAMNELFQARATLNSIIDNAPNKEIVNAAKQKLAKLDGAKSPNPAQLQDSTPQQDSLSETGLQLQQDSLPEPTIEPQQDSFPQPTIIEPLQDSVPKRDQ